MQVKSGVHGFTLIESLIALAVLSVGLLGAAVMLLESLRTQSDSLRRAAAGSLLRDMADRIRANSGAGASYGAQPSGAADACDSSGCDVTQLAAADLARFEQQARASLPGEIRAAVEFVPAIGPAALDRFIISLRWRDPRAEEDTSVMLQMLAPPVAG
jgi:type IV pilus assembly protein PilV